MITEKELISAQAELDQRWSLVVDCLIESGGNGSIEIEKNLRERLVRGDLAGAITSGASPVLVARLAGLAMDEAFVRLSRRVAS